MSKVLKAVVLLGISVFITLTLSYGLLLLMASYGFPVMVDAQTTGVNDGTQVGQQTTQQTQQGATGTGSTGGTATTVIDGTGATGTTGTTGATNTTVPGVPNTGEGGDRLANIAILLSSAFAAAAGLVYLVRPAEERPRR